MTLKQALARAREILATSIEEASIESELLLRHVLQMSRVQLYLDLDCQLSPEEEDAFWQLVERRKRGEPTAYIIGHREFYGLGFYVDNRVLIPRPESELLVEQALSRTKEQAVSTIADIGTGCGAIAIALALNLPQAKIYATDISAKALEVALINCQRHGVADRVCLLQGDMLSPLPEAVDIIVANLPYVEKSELPRVSTAGYEPVLALAGGSSGLEKIFRLCRQVEGKLRSSGCLLLEVGQGQAQAVTTLLRGLFPSFVIEVIPDLSGIDRVVKLG